MNRIVASLFVLAGAASYGLLGPFVKMAYDAGFTPHDVTSSQFSFALLMMVLLASAQFRQLQKLNRRDYGKLAFLGISVTGTSIFYYVSLAYLPASLAIVFLFQFSWIVMVIDYFVTRKTPTLNKWVSLGLVLTGTVLAVDLFQTDWKQVSSLGLLFGVLSALTYSAFLYWNEKIENQASAVINSLVLTTVSTIAIFFVFPPKFLWNGTLSQGLWVWALIIGGLGQVIPPIMFNKGIPVVGGALAGILAAVELPVATIAASVMLHETVTITEWLGVGLILSGILVAEMRKDS